MRFVKTIPSLVRSPLILEEGKLNDLLSYKGFDEITGSKYNILMQTISDLIYKVTGQIFSERSLEVVYDNDNSIAGTIFMPYRMTSLTEVKIDDIVQNLSDFVQYEDKIVYKDNYFPIGNQHIKITGNFGYTVTEGLPVNIEFAIMILIEDMMFGDKYDRMQSNASKVKLDVIEIEKKKTSYGSVTGNEEVDRLLSDLRWTHSPIIMKEQAKYIISAMPC